MADTPGSQRKQICSSRGNTGSAARCKVPECGHRHGIPRVRSRCRSLHDEWHNWCNTWLLVIRTTRMTVQKNYESNIIITRLFVSCRFLGNVLHPLPSISSACPVRFIFTFSAFILNFVVIIGSHLPEEVHKLFTPKAAARPRRMKTYSEEIIRVYYGLCVYKSHIYWHYL